MPPGPITMPSIAAIDAVLNYQHHNYFYFCARDSFDGRHAFASSYTEHLHNANAYHAAYRRWEREKEEAAAAEAAAAQAAAQEAATSVPEG